MRRTLGCSLRLGLVLPLLLALGASPAFAHERGHGPPPIRGVVIDLSSTSLQVQTQSGGVSVGLTSRTHVLRVVSGSLADLTKGWTVELHVISGTTTVDAIRVEPGRSGSLPRYEASGELSAHGRRRAGTARPLGPAQIVSASETSITVRYHNGQTVTYTLSANVSITKVMNGHLTDLAVGEDVQIFLARGASSAISVTIFNT